MALLDKVKWILGILMVFVLIIATNLIDKNNFVRVKDSVVTIYEDRLIAKDLIFKISKAIHKKEIALATNDSLFFSQKNKAVNQQIESLVDRFEKTKLTDVEENVFKNFKKNFSSLTTIEANGIDFNSQNKLKASGQISALENNLDDLAQIQISEGSRQMSISKQAIESVELFTQMEIYILVVLAIIIQVIVIYNPKEKKQE
ncbi:chemoreceptor-like protein with four helix bundle sensory module [Kordia periserrulae]|uniref:Chemoreceptor-like protein with four helix bundle sensory module n=1 Tax=Kordia periserrulae TaxID=701523 RepID=A0A2T6BTT7_9FLAO|nr:MCP four helix bundle domain-containing protein [Kordia periserrulae]PTX59482.1 chemoreceptor-like protein with four helix bundle sensory module [Kordia periserrulae]